MYEYSVSDLIDLDCVCRSSFESTLCAEEGDPWADRPGLNEPRRVDPYRLFFRQDARLDEQYA